MSPLEVLGAFAILYAMTVVVICIVRVATAVQHPDAAWGESTPKMSKREWKLQVLTRILQADCDKVKRIMNSR